MSATTRLRGAVQRRPWASSVAVVLTHLLLMVVVSRALPLLRSLGLPPGFPELGATVVNLFGLAFGLGLVAALGWWHEIGLTRLWPRRDAWLLLPLVAVSGSLSLWGLHGSPAAWLGGAVLYLALGLNEEVLNRGVVQQALSGLSVRAGVLGSAALFGAGHIVNGLFFGRAWGDTAAQVVSNVCIGVAFAAVRWRTESLWPLIVLHGVGNLLIWRSGPVPRVLFLLIAVVNLTYGLWLLRRLEREPPPAQRTAQPVSSANG